jgi:flagellar basal-body rod protein FlgG
MIQGLLSAAAGMEAQQQQLDAAANDLANVSTPGYQSEEVGFNDLLYTAGGSSSGSKVATGAGAAAQVVGRDQTEGAIQQTGQPLDVAVIGQGYIEVRRPDGTIGLTRNGTLQTNAQGTLMTSTGMPLMPPITIPPGVDPSQVKIDPNGTVRVGARTLGRISIVTVPAPSGLIADGDSSFSATVASGTIRPATGSTLQQGSLESSNVDLASAMSEMIDAEQGYDMASKAIQYQDQMLQVANEVKK